MERGDPQFSSFRTKPRQPIVASRDIEEVFSRASTSAARYVSDSSSENTTRLDESLSEVIRFISEGDYAARLTLKNTHVLELLDYTPVTLSANTTNAITRSRFYRMLFTIAFRNIPIRRYMACELELCASIFNCLKISLREELGPQNMIDILRLLQVLCYEKTATLGIWTNELISFLIGEVCREPEQEWMAYCIAILCNLATRSKSVCNRIKKSSSYKQFSRRIMTLLQHNARIIVVSSLVLIGYLEERVRDVVYCTKNVHETFQCVFNVLILGDDDCLMTRQIAADLLRRLIVSDTPALSSTPTLATTGQDILKYDFFDNCIQQTAALLINLDPMMEESMKIYDLFLSLCSLQILRSSVCHAILKFQPTDSRLTTPVLAIAKTASIDYRYCINSEVPLKALKLLAYLLKEIIEPNEKIHPIVPINHLINLIEDCIKTPIDPNDENVEFACRRVHLGLKLAEIVSRDEDFRPEVLNICSAHLCNQIANYQFHQNPVVLYLTKPPLQRTESLKQWSISGICIVLELCRLLAVLKDHSKMHKDQYWQLLKDDHLVPFLAYAIAFGDHETVQHAFVTYSHCTQIHAFPSNLLAEMLASCTLQRRLGIELPKNSQTSTQDVRNGLSDRPQSAELDERSLKSLDELLKRVSIEGASLKDAKTSDIFAAFERKISFLMARERDLEALLKAKDDQLTQSEKLRMQYRGTSSGQNTNFVSDVEISKMRLIMQECEDLREKNQSLNRLIETTKQKHVIETAELQESLMRSAQECEKLKIELKDGQKMIDSFSLSCEDLKRKLDLSTANCVDQQKKLTKIENDFILATNEVKCLKLEADRTRQSHETEIVKLNADVAQKVTRIEQFINENFEIKRLYEEKHVECEAIKEQTVQFEGRLMLKEREVAKIHEQLINAEQRQLTRDRELLAAQKEVELYEERLSNKERENTNIYTEMQRIREELESTKGELSKMEQLQEAMYALASSNRKR
ncbi:unnamed protein product [Caenorhabditis angaria]|uniref:CIP2A N-terminal domain-containing protein n=1 Tax=Caenorhabditis angaria TaxID=860376 RepID=A0A9P1MYJ5_9PELO|nr:unnamed protein product [Caenorhabditis angaria]